MPPFLRVFFRYPFQALLLLILLFVMPVLSLDYGITYDEAVQQAYGTNVFHFFSSGFKDLSALSSGGGLKYYGGMFDFLCVCAQKIFSFADIYDVRHILNSLFGWLLILFTSLLSTRLFGNLAGVLSILFYVLSPRIFADMMNNPKDIPFAAFYVASLYGFSFIKSDFPFFEKKHLIGLILAIALCLNIRSGGLILLGYAGLLVIAMVFLNRKSWSVCFFKKTIGWTFLCMIITQVLGGLFWPWVLFKPVIRLWESFFVMSHYSWEGLVLFKGQDILSTKIPWDYIPYWFVLTTPMALLFLSLIGLAVGFLQKNKTVFCLCFSFFFPWISAVLIHSVLYDGWRHFYFLYSPFIIISAYGASVLLKVAQKYRSAQVIIAFLMALSFYPPLYFSIHNHPFQTVYFNELIGGVKGAAGNFELDYWGSCYKDVVHKLADIAIQEQRTISFKATIGSHMAEYYAKSKPLLHYTAEEGKAEFELVLLRSSFDRIQELLHSNNKIYATTVDSVPLCLMSKLK